VSFPVELKNSIGPCPRCSRDVAIVSVGGRRQAIEPCATGAGDVALQVTIYGGIEAMHAARTNFRLHGPRCPKRELAASPRRRSFSGDRLFAAIAKGGAR